MKPVDFYSRDYSKESVANTVFSTTNQMLLAFPRDFVERCKPMPIQVMRYVDVRDFGSELRKDLVLQDIAATKKDDLGHADWAGIAWTRGKLNRYSGISRKYKGINRSMVNPERGDGQLQVIAKAELDLFLTIFSSAPEWLQCIQEILSVNRIDGGFDFTFYNQTYRASYVPPFDIGQIDYVGREKNGNLAMCNIALRVTYPLALNISGGSLVKEINTKIIAINHQEMELLDKESIIPNYAEDAVIGRSRISTNTILN